MKLSTLAHALPRWWFRPTLAWPLWPLLPFSFLFAAVAGLRRCLFRLGVLSAERLPVPVVVVGNLTVGGSGKTPLVLWLVDQLKQAGRRPGIVSRGYGAADDAPRPVASAGNPAWVGDEPLLLARRSGVPVFVGRDRPAAARALLAAHPECDVIVSDDGLQHYRLARAAEIAVFDARGAGNGWLLPAGPLREPRARLNAVTAAVWNGVDATAAVRWAASVPAFTMRLHGECFYRLGQPERRCDAHELANNLAGRRCYALAGIGDPSRFFAQLAALGLDCETRAFPDHHAYTADDLAFASDGVLLMTEKDAVKCTELIAGEAWVLPVDARVEAAADGRSLIATVLEKIDGRAPA